ncbi:MAG: protein-L-isoaspartate(D-aspartate) O-methyltransferase, partial [Acidobacteria bacterium]|nr:protein-L-isoaspartate(D-aspartate) O-methyltransferase [Acidobacteriota bacterium]
MPCKGCLRYLVCCWLVIGCDTAPRAQPSGDTDRFAAARRRMVDEQIAARGIRDRRVLEAMVTVPRHLFVSADFLNRAYDDHPLPIGHDQTISQPYIVALMTETARPQPTDRAFEVGTGSGYQAAVLSYVVAQVYTIELIEPLGKQAAERLARLGHRNVTVRVGDGYQGWPEQAPFDVIVVTAAPEEVPQPLLDQLKAGGRLVIPVGPTGATQELLLLEKDAKGTISRRSIAPVQFVP